MLCPRCEATRFPPAQVSSGSEPAAPSNSTATITTDIIPTTATTATMEQQMDALRSEIQLQKATILALQKRLSIVLSLLGIAEADAPLSEQEGGSKTNAPEIQADVNEYPTDSTVQLAWTNVAAKTKSSSSNTPSMQSHANTFRQSLVAAVYTDQAERKRRESSLVVNGLNESQTLTDKVLFENLCRNEFALLPDITSTRRLGRVQPNRIRPLLIFTREASQAQQLIASAKQLRKSPTQAIRDNVYITRNLTKAEAEAAFLSRDLRRRRAAARLNNAVPATREDRTGVVEQSTNTNADISLSLLNIANNPQLIVPPPPINCSQMPTYTIPHASSFIDRQVNQPQQSGRLGQ